MSIRILIVEDNPVARGFLARVVREAFFDASEVIEVPTLAAARAVLGLDARAPARRADAAGDFGLVLCSLEVVDGRGLELFEQLRHTRSCRVATTLYSDDDGLFPAMQLGAAGYLLKEERFEVLVEELQRIVRGAPSMSAAIARRTITFFRELGSAPAAGDAGDSRFLSPREAEVLGQIGKGFTLKEIARSTSARWGTLHEHVRSIYRKLAASSHEVVLEASDERED
jgi:DNA-binding NarL/FixJ family response regulator